MARWPRGLRHSLAKGADPKGSRGFESHLRRHSPGKGQVAEWSKAPHWKCGRGGDPIPRGFESRPVRQRIPPLAPGGDAATRRARVAQSGERRVVDPKVVGSKPTSSANTSGWPSGRRRRIANPVWRKPRESSNLSPLSKSTARATGDRSAVHRWEAGRDCGTVPGGRPSPTRSPCSGRREGRCGCGPQSACRSGDGDRRSTGR